MGRNAMLARWSRVAALAVALLIAACSGGTFSRGLFTGYVMGQSAAQVEEKVGKPVSIQSPDADHQVWVYEKKTFDPDNANAEDARTSVYFERRGGQLIATDVRYT